MGLVSSERPDPRPPCRAIPGAGVGRKGGFGTSEALLVVDVQQCFINL